MPARLEVVSVKHHIADDPLSWGAAVVEFVARGRASIVQPDADRPPLLMYEDGGAMALPLVR